MFILSFTLQETVYVMAPLMPSVHFHLSHIWGSWRECCGPQTALSHSWVAEFQNIDRLRRLLQREVQCTFPSQASSTFSKVAVLHVLTSYMHHMCGLLCFQAQETSLSAHWGHLCWTFSGLVMETAQVNIPYHYVHSPRKSTAFSYDTSLSTLPCQCCITSNVHS